MSLRSEEKKCKVGDFRKLGVGLPYRGKVLVTQEVEGLAPDGESRGGQLRAMQRALDMGGLSAGELAVSLGETCLPQPQHP